MLQTLWDSLSPTVLPIFGSVFAAMMAWLVAQIIAVSSAIRAKTGLDIEASLRDALHMALASGAQAALQKNLSGQPAVQAAVDHAKASVPGAIAKLRAPDGILANLAKAKLGELIAGAVAKVGK